MRLSRSCLVLFLSLLLLAGLAACGQASSDNAPNLGPRASVGGPPLSKQGPSPGNNPLTPFTPAANHVPLVLGNETGVASGKETVPGGDSHPGLPVPSTKPADSLEPLVVPAWMAKELDSPDVATRLQALETWAQSAPPGAVDPLIMAYDEKVEQDWARSADAEQPSEGAEDTNERAGSGDTGVIAERLSIDPLKR